MTTGLDKKTFLVLGLGFAGILLICSRLERDAGIALVSGYFLFSLNFLFLLKIYAGLVAVMRTGQSSGRLKTGILIGSAIKFFGLIAALYALIVLWKLPGLYIAVGSLISLFLLTTLLLLSYLKNFGSSSVS